MCIECGIEKRVETDESILKAHLYSITGHSFSKNSPLHSINVHSLLQLNGVLMRDIRTSRNYCTQLT